MRWTTILLTVCLVTAWCGVGSAASESRGFGAGADRKGTGFGRAVEKSSDERAADDGEEADEDRPDPNRAYARGLMKQYDKNGDGVLERDEWKAISGSPERSDANGDGRITADELYERVSSRNLGDRGRSTRRRGESRDRDGSRQRETRVSTNKSSSDEDSRPSYRLTTPHERLPDGLPGWFKQKDTDLDGQVAMHEYSRSWDASTVRKFVDLDKNGDGLITPSEAKSGR